MNLRSSFSAGLAVLILVGCSSYESNLPRSRNAVRAQVGHGINLAAGAKVAVSEFYQDRGAYPANNATAGLEAAANISGKYVSQVAVTGAGLVQVTFGNDVNGKIATAILTFTPSDNTGSLEWICTGDATLVDKWLPSSCR